MKLWDNEAKFFKVLLQGTNKDLTDVRELHGFTPWYFNLRVKARDMKQHGNS